MRFVKRLGQEDGIAMATVIGVIAVLTVTSIVLIDQVFSEFHNATAAVSSNAVYQAAEAGIGDYVSKLNEDPIYYDHQVGKGEATRQSCAAYSNGSCTSYGTLVVSPVANGQTAQAWTTGTHWGYPNGADNFFSGTGNAYGNSTVLKGYAYDLMVTPPSSSLGTTYISVLSTGCKLISGGTTCDPSTPKQSILTRVSRSTPANFQYMVPDMSGYRAPCFASNLYGIVYSVGTISVCGANAYGNLLAETSVSGSVNLISPAKIYTPTTNPSIRTQVPQPVSFSQLTVSLASLQRAAALNSPRTVFDDSSAAAWQINFSPNGTFQVWKCVFVSGSGGTDPAYSQPYCDNLTLSTITSSHGTVTITTNGGTDGLPNNGQLTIGSSGRTDTFNYSSRSNTSTTTTFTGTWASTNYTHSANERVSYYPSAPWAEPYYSGPLPPNNAIYTGQDAIVSWPTAVSGSDGTSCPTYVGTPASAVNGRVTVGSNTDVIVAGDLCYSSQASGVNDDVLGLVANGNVWIADYAPSNLWWRSATIALNGTWGDYDCTTSQTGPYNNSMTFVGTAAYSSSTGCMDSGGGVGYRIGNVNRVADDGSMATINACPSTAPDCASYNALQFLFPPWFPVLNGEKIGLFQEVKPSTLLPVG